MTIEIKSGKDLIDFMLMQNVPDVSDDWDEQRKSKAMLVAINRADVDAKNKALNAKNKALNILSEELDAKNEELDKRKDANIRGGINKNAKDLKQQEKLFVLEQ